MVGQARTLTFNNVPEAITFETDPTVQLVQTTNSNEQTTDIKLLPSKTNKQHALVVRAYENGPVLASLDVDTFWVQAATDNYIWVVERQEDYEIWENTSFVKNLPESAYIKIGIMVSGVTFEDMTLERVITKADYDAIGEYAFHLIHPNELGASTCHYIKAYDGHPNQGGTLLGEAYYGAKLIGEVEV